MIVNRLKAKNFLKYGSLDLDELPTRGLVAVSGPNESGKSTVGETLCFALFGRTFSLDADDRARLVKWGEMRASVELEFTTGDDRRYRVSRYIDNEGTHGARLDLADGTSLAQGPEAVQRALDGLLGFDYESFIESFYLAQREITAPHAHSHAVKSIAGLVPLEAAANDLRAALDTSLQDIARVEHDRALVQKDLGALDIDEGRFDRLSTLRDAARDTIARLGATTVALEQASNVYGEGKVEMRRADDARGSARFGAWLFFLLAVGAGAVWGAVTQLPTHPLTLQFLATLDQVFPQGKAYLDPWLGAGAAVCALLWLLFAARGSSAAGRRRRTAEDMNVTVGQLQPLFDDPGATRADGVLRDVHELSGHSADVPVVESLPTLPVSDFSPSTLESLGIAPRELAGLVISHSNALSARRGAMERAIAWMDGALARERATLAEARRLQGVIDDMNRQIATEQQHNRVRTLSLELLAGAARELSVRFNANVRGSAGRILPLFTEGRYQHIKIDPALTVQVFSKEKGDFMELDEISSGTQRQIMLAVRLALAQELIEQKAIRPQFLFLDEPFAFFDRARTESSVRALPQLSDDIPQVWVTAQEFPTDISFERSVVCAREAEWLVGAVAA